MMEKEHLSFLHDANHVESYAVFAQKMWADTAVLLREYWTKALETH